MEVYHQREAESLSPARLLQDVLLAVPSSLGIHPYPQTDGVDATFVAEKAHTFGLLAVRIVEFLTLGFQLGQPADVCAKGKGGGSDRLSRGYKKGCHSTEG